MNLRLILFALVLFPLAAVGQKPTSQVDGNPVRAPELNTTTRAVLLANRPPQFSDAEWLKMMEKSVNRSFYPLRLSPAMLDTLDARQLDIRYRYEMVPGEKTRSREDAH